MPQVSTFCFVDYGTRVEHNENKGGVSRLFLGLLGPIFGT